MQFFLVFQRNQYYQHERGGGYLWAPKTNPQGRTFHHWENMQKIETGDIIFSSKNRQIVSINVAQSDCSESERPEGLEGWNPRGWKVEIKYNELDEPIDVNQHIDRILIMQPTKYAPFNVNGRGNQGYLFEITPELAHYLLRVSGVRRLSGAKTVVDKMWQRSLLTQMEESQHLAEQVPNETEREQVMKARIGQGVFRSLLLARYGSCVLCNLDRPEFLIASHIKPWRSSTTDEKLDENNGLLLCPNHDALLDKGYIAFTDEGELLVSSGLSERNQSAMGIRSGLFVSLPEAASPYLKWHRENLFKDE